MSFLTVSRKAARRAWHMMRVILAALFCAGIAWGQQQFETFPIFDHHEYGFSRTDGNNPCAGPPVNTPRAQYTRLDGATASVPVSFTFCPDLTVSGSID